MLVHKEPAFVLTYGPSGSGKTTDNLYSFPAALYLAAPGALKPALGVCGYEPRKAKTEPAHIMAVTELLTKHSGRLKSEGVNEVVIDDFSLLAERTFAFLENKLSGFKLFGEMRNVLIEFRDAARRAGVHVILNAHLNPPTLKPDPMGINVPKSVKGGPRLPGRMPEDMPTACDLVLRTDVDASRRGWQVVYRCSVLDTDYVTKDRHNVTPAVAPMNLGEILRLSGYAVKRLPSIAEWQEAVVEKGATALMQTTTADEETNLLRALAAACTDKYKAAPQHVQWTLRDALDRAQLRKAQANKLNTLFGI